MKNNEEKVFSPEDEEIIEKLADRGSYYYKYRDRVDLILEALKRNPEMITYVPGSLRMKKSFYDKVKKIIPEENLHMGYNTIEEPTVGNIMRSAGQKIADKYQAIDDFYMGRDLSSKDIWVERTIALAFTPLPYIHLVTKGVVGIGKGIVSLSEYAHEKYKKAQLEKMMSDEENVDSSSKSLK